ncbi:MAG: SDR family oxidoreductase [Proteobacteria bacterium]|nr:SDR family oxidoreductase [Pseudomonadota bacterium]
MDRLADRTVLVSGGAGPMGEAIAERCLAEGARVVLADRSAKRVQAAQQRLAPADRLLAETADMLDAASVAALFAATRARFGEVDGIVNVVGGVAGSALRTPLLELGDEQFDATLHVNLRGILQTARQAVAAMRRRGRGRIVNVSSVSMAGEAGQADYSAAKAGVAALTRTMAIEFAPEVTVNCIAPSLIRTRVLERVDPALLAQWRDRTLLKRLGEPIDVAHAAVFLLSDESSFITGVQLPVSGGIWPAL